jgi:hypothetical protein
LVLEFIEEEMLRKTAPPLRTTVTQMRRLKRNTGRKLETTEEAMMRRAATLQP